jgi:hypothetical protein
MRYLIEVCVDDFMAIVIPTTKKEVTHVCRVVMHGIHDIFPAHNTNANDPISEKKLLKGEGEMSTTKTMLGFDFDGFEKTMWLKLLSETNYSPFSTSGYKQANAAPMAYPSRNLNRSSQKYDTISHLCQRV